MKLQSPTLRSLTKFAACAALALGLMPQLYAADATGTWGWTTPSRQGGEPRKSTLQLKVDGQKLTGKLTQPGRQGGDPRITEISNGVVKGDTITFNVKRQAADLTFVIKYSGKLTGDTIKGKIGFERNGVMQTRDWEAKRQPAPAK